MTRQRETYGHAARERDLLRDSVELAVPKLARARQLLAVTANSFEIDNLLRRAIHDLTVGVE
jgi:hypothetical protein